MADEPEFLSSYTWSGSDPGFGGFSGIEVSADGKNFTLVSDGGNWIGGSFERKGGKITGVAAAPLTSLVDSNGIPLIKWRIDAEGLATDRHGRSFVSFEAVHRVVQFDKNMARVGRLKDHDEFKGLQNNSGLEALAIDDAGVLYTLPERSGEWTRPFPVYRFANGQWDQKLSLPRRDKFLPVGADFGPDGKFYLLERDFVWYRGFANRIRRFEVGKDGFTNEETLLTTKFGTFDNLEGISVWRDENGLIRMTMISDDNFSLVQVTQFVEFSLTE